MIKNRTIQIGLIIILFFSICLTCASIASAYDGTKVSEHLKNVVNRPEASDASGSTLKKRSLPEVIGAIINGILGFLGSICLIVILYAGVRIMMAGGNEETVVMARKTIKWAIIGVIVVLGSYALSYYITNEVLKATKPPPQPVVPIEEEEFGYEANEFYCSVFECESILFEDDCINAYDIDSGDACCSWDAGGYNVEQGVSGVCY
jgi:hypothetical protein